jgi:hypothetical protein
MRWRTRDSDGAGENRPPNLLFAHGPGRTVLQQAPHFERSTYMQDYLYSDISGERPESIAQRSRNQQQLATANRAIDAFFQKTEQDVLMRGAGSARPTDLRELQKAIGIESEDRPVRPEVASCHPTDNQFFMKGSDRVFEAKNRLLASIDRFVEHARESIRKREEL